MNLFELTIQNVLIWTGIFWHYSLRCGYISDDHSVIAGRRDIIPDAEKNPKKEKLIVKIFNDGIVMYCINTILFKLRADKWPFIWHALTLGVHLINVYLLHLLLLPVFGQQISIITCILWAINPMHNQVVVWVSGRPYSIGLCLALLAMLNWQNPAIFIPLYGLAVITNISIVFVPIILKVMHPGTTETTIYIWAMLGMAAPFILWKFKQRFTQALVLDRENFNFKFKRVFATTRLYAYYIWALICPIKMGWYHQGGFKYNTVWEKINAWTVVSIGVCIFLLPNGIGKLWFFLFLLPNINLFATNSFIQDRYVYAGSIGLAIIIAPFITPEILIALTTFYGVRTYMYSRHMKNDEKLYRENMRNHPKSGYAVNNLAFFLIQQKRFVEARVEIEKSIQTTGGNKMLWYNMGICWAATGNVTSDEGKFRYLRSIDCWKKALALEPRWKKPATDIEQMTKFLIEHKVITMDKHKAADGGQTIDIPVLGIKDGKKK